MLKFTDLTIEQKDKLCNGWGPKGAGAVVPEFYLHEYCDEHDFDYWVGGSIVDRWKADFKLLTSGIKAAGWRPDKQLVAFIYWNAVRVGGIACWNYGEKRCEKDLDELMKTNSLGGGDNGNYKN